MFPQKYFEALLPKLVPFQKKKGGPIIAFQVENEYGDYTNQDRDHLPWLKKLMAWLKFDFFMDQHGSIMTKLKF